MPKKGLIIVNTGNGKGKTTAALGLAFRMLGHKNKKVAIVQFIKGSWKYGELESAKRFSDALEIQVMGRGFTYKSEDFSKDVAVAKEAWQRAKDVIAANEHDMVILDELTYLITLNMIPEAEIIEALMNKPEQMHVVVTGRGATEKLIDLADLVTEMKEIKHPYKSGIKAQRGVEF
ncbi:MAG: cob(I)yrinic acid a,c-diamide adenosyltransferase [Deltaproteobacteria bacterium]|nr:cob(I)yrinic acid a,c-diamide adenosyltransferase [Deltaproteobacteria bacterium]